MGQVVLIAGLPCSGKTTLGSRLGAVTGAHHVSVGDLVRTELEHGRMPPEAERSFLGGGEFSVEWLSDLVRAHLSGCAQELVILDAGGPPLDEIALQLNAAIRCALILVAPEQARENRFAARASGTRRSDDEENLFHARSGKLNQRMGAFGRSLSRLCPTFELDSGGSVHTTLQAALQALAMADLERARRSAEPSVSTLVPPRVLATPGTLRRLWARDNPVSIVTAEGEHGAGAELVLLMKPGVGATSVVEAAVLGRLAHFGCTVRGVAVWSRQSGLLELLARAHLGLHHVISQAGSQALSDAQLDVASALDPTGRSRVVGGFEFERRFGSEACSSAWLDRGVAPSVRKIGPYAWASPVEEHRLVMLNGHIPDIVRSYGQTERVMALQILVPPSCPTDRLRREMLGATDPTQAAPGSLRRLAIDGELELGWTPDFRNNAFHLSDSPEEGMRELDVWFGNGKAPGRFARSSSNSSCVM